ncbi:allantoin [Xylariales sp. PMI_506]|nr:allantoin [Xylariales sp. PMI_506]
MAPEYLAKKWASFRHALTSPAAFNEWIQAPATELDAHGHPYRRPGSRWSNEDLDPTPPAKRTWSWVNYVTFYVALSFGNWTLGSSMVGIGLNWWESIVVIFVSQLISSVAMFYNSRAASVYHIGYPVVGRSVFGMFGSYYVVGARALLAIIWYGIQLYSGASFLNVMLRCVFGHNYMDIPNTIPASVGITSAAMVGFFLFWLIHMGFTPFRPYQMRPFWWFKVTVMMPGIFGLFIFCMVNTKADLGSVYAGTIPAGTSKGWFIIQAINAGMGNTANLITNQPDIARWSKTKTASMWSQLIANPLAVTISATLGILSTAAINNSWGLALWNPWDLLGAILDKYWTASGRTAVFLCASAWSVSLLGTNIAANMIPFGSDVTLLFPKYMTIPRGQFLVNCLAFAICPWQILQSAAVFTTFLSGYGLFMASVAAIMIADYWLLTKGNIAIGHLYNPGRENPHYYYYSGWNVQAYIAYIAGIALPFAGFVGTLGPTVSSAATKMGQLGWCLSFATSFLLYWGICLVWPTKNQKLIKDMDLGWEALASDEIVTVDGTTLVERGSAVVAEEGEIVESEIIDTKI